MPGGHFKTNPFSRAARSRHIRRRIQARSHFRKSRIPISQWLNLWITVTALLGLGTASLAGETTITPGFTSAVSFSDNIDQEPDGLKEDAYVIELTPSVQVRSEGAGFDGALDALTQFSYTSDGDDDGLNAAPIVSLQTTSEVSENLLFFDANGSISQQLLDSEQSDTDANRDTTYAYFASPYLLNRFGSFAESETRYTFSQVHVDDDEFSTDTTNAGRLTIDSGDDFRRLRWTTLGLLSHTDRSDDPSIERRLIDQELEYGVNRQFSLIGAGGYEYFDDGEQENEVDGPTWRGGFRLRGPRGELVVTYGRRDDDDSFAGDFNYRIGAFTSVRAGYSESLETDQERLLNDTSNIGVDPDTGALIDNDTGLAFDPAASNTSFSNETTYNKTLTAGINFIKGRDILDLTVRIEDQEDQAGADDEEHQFVGLTWDRRMSRKMTLRLFGSYEHSEFQDDDTTDDEYIAGALLSYNIRDNVSIFGTYVYRQQDSTDAADEFTENRATIGLTYTFDTLVRSGGR